MLPNALVWPHLTGAPDGHSLADVCHYTPPDACCQGFSFNFYIKFT